MKTMKIGCFFVLIFSMVQIEAAQNHLFDLLYENQIVKRGDFTLKSGAKSDIYIDMRAAISSPDLMDEITAGMQNSCSGIPYDRICGVPYGAVSFATALALKVRKPLVMLRKEVKNYGTQKVVEGAYKPGDQVLLVEDVVTTGSSILEAIEELKKQQLVVKNVLVLLDRQQGGAQMLENAGYQVHRLMKLSELQTYKPVRQPDYRSLSYEKRAQLVNNAVAKKLFLLMEQKRSNLCVAADVTRASELLEIAQMVGPFICILKIHIDLLEDFKPSVITQLQSLAAPHNFNFLLMEDRKFADIGSTVEAQYTKGIYRIAEWADLVTVHAVAGTGMIDQMKRAVDTTKHGAFIIAQMSTAQTLARGAYTQQAIDIARQHDDFIIGSIARNIVDTSPSTVHAMAGISLNAESIGDQCYVTPQKAILDLGADICIVGRDIYKSKNRVEMVKQYCARSWAAYQIRKDGW
jgi:uridine monophosphate synthetase